MIRARELGFGLETDLRDFNGLLVVSHDLASENNQVFRPSDFLGFDGPVALNVKADGLLALIRTEAQELLDGPSEIFFFDMSIPELVQYRNSKLPFAVRLSEYENIGPIQSKWIWLDGFESDWFSDRLNLLLDTYPESNLVVVSPELHKRPHLKIWSTVQQTMPANERLYICTDYPEDFVRGLEK